MKYILLLAVFFATTSLPARYIGDGEVSRYMVTGELLVYKPATDINILPDAVVRFKHNGKTFYIDSYYEISTNTPVKKKRHPRRSSNNKGLISVIMLLLAAAGWAFFYIKKKRDEEEDDEV